MRNTKLGAWVRRGAATLVAAGAVAGSLTAASSPAAAATAGKAYVCRNQTVYASKAHVGPFYYRIAAYSNAGNSSNGKPFLHFGVYLADLQSNPEKTTKEGYWQIHISGTKGYRYGRNMRPVRSLKKRTNYIDFERGLYETARWHNRSFYAQLITGNVTVIKTGWLKIGCPEQR